SRQATSHGAARRMNMLLRRIATATHGVTAEGSFDPSLELENTCVAVQFQAVRSHYARCITDRHGTVRFGDFRIRDDMQEARFEHEVARARRGHSDHADVALEVDVFTIPRHASFARCHRERPLAWGE